MALNPRPGNPHGVLPSKARNQAFSNILHEQIKAFEAWLKIIIIIFIMSVSHFPSTDMAAQQTVSALGTASPERLPEATSGGRIGHRSACPNAAVFLKYNIRFTFSLDRYGRTASGFRFGDGLPRVGILILFSEWFQPVGYPDCIFDMISFGVAF